MGHGQNVWDKVKVWWDKVKSYGTECSNHITINWSLKSSIDPIKSVLVNFCVSLFIKISIIPQSTNLAHAFKNSDLCDQFQMPRSNKPSRSRANNSDLDPSNKIHIYTNNLFYLYFFTLYPNFYIDRGIFSIVI